MPVTVHVMLHENLSFVAKEGLGPGSPPEKNGAILCIFGSTERL